MSSNGEPPPGWDEPNPTMIEAARGMRAIYLGLLSVGFTMQEACAIIGAILVANTRAGSVSS